MKLSDKSDTPQYRLAHYAFFWVAAAVFVATIAGHWLFAWLAYVNEQAAQQLPIELGEYLARTARASLENWQTDLLPLVWEVAGLALLSKLASPSPQERGASRHVAAQGRAKRALVRAAPRRGPVESAG